MYIIVGGTGHVGSAVAKTLLDEGKAVTIVTRNPEKAGAWRQRGAEVALADVHDVTSLRQVFRHGKRAFLLNPNADISSDTDREERKTVRCLLEAIEGSGLEKVVAQSTMGAQPGEECGDLNVLYELEVGLRNQPIPASVVRAAYYYSNWDAMLGSIKRDGVLSTMLPADLKLPMVAPEDLGRVAARLLQEPIELIGIYPVEGPKRYSANDVAAAFAAAVGRAVRVDVIPRENWENAYRSLGFSVAAARSYARMTALTVDGPEYPEDPIRGSISIQAYIGQLLRNSS
ncbi:NmrA family NAD(P)-binding protein [Rhizobium lentis]|uniref:NmrA family NAD(P)-binding protein n=1 Tax=Rhizobium lentis TaxID=1138194 RepID=UPI001C83CDCD|nr:NmrA family NAD(P)-binding protein [Rhizobium lentis]MBX4973302.1 NmrA family NAD(P)-binding protein [Rhizobium lentis]MBX5082459.1 NmrA family NAD(P)-binding protein [Rhizobium lentis]MBX5095169.1 NmrA family NAD(P)-binding protein [Rhizobium lentis]MBX5105682.1 NmrA family NAD(P)-binding protein [Rhizobium lentis]MBX5119894.1 NmrA family NAD(P)-binding protein [Rhizobium lentis]